MNTARLASLLQFWPRQMSEHALFLALGIEQADVRLDARSHHVQWELFREEKLQKLTATTNYHDLVQKCHGLGKVLRAFKMHIYERQRKGEWLGWIYPSFILHMVRELDFFMASLDRAVGGAERPQQDAARDEIQAALPMMQERARIASSYVDPEQFELSSRLRDVQATFGNLEIYSEQGDLTRLISLSRRAGTILDGTLKSQSQPGVLVSIFGAPPAVWAHFKRETEDFLRMLHSAGEGMLK